MGLLSRTDLSEGTINVHDIVLLKQKCSSVYTEIDDLAMSAYYDQCFDKGMEIGEFGCVWLHTHPGESCQPSSKDEETFRDVFKRHPWALMLILGQKGDMYGRVKSNFPNIQQEVDVIIDWTDWNGVFDTDIWIEQYARNVNEIQSESAFAGTGHFQNQVADAFDWVNYCTFEETNSEFGSKATFEKKLDDARSLYASRKDYNSSWASDMCALRSKLIGGMQRGILYEAEVQLLLWYNWFLQKKSWKAMYPTCWKTFVEQEGMTIVYGKEGPTMRVDVIEPDDGFDMDGYGYGYQPKTKELPAPKPTSKKLDGKPCYWGTVRDAMAKGERVISGGETFYFYKNRLYQPEKNRVVSSDESDAILACATNNEIQLVKEVK